MRYPSCCAVVTLAAVLGAAPAAAARLLLEGPELSATLDQALRCDEPVSVTVEAQQPEAFQAESSALQALIDAVHAMLAFECPDLREIRVHGVLKGLQDPVYRGTARRETDWVLQTEQAVSSGVAAAPGAVPDQGRGAGYTVANLSRGMTVEEAQAAVADTFGVASNYDAAAGVLTLNVPGCPRAAQQSGVQRPPAPGWKCLTAWFTDERVAQLFRLELVQVVAHRGIEPIEQALIARYGQPVQRGSAPPWSGASRPGSETLYLAWGELPPGVPPDYPLEAVIEPIGDVIVTTVTLDAPRGASERTNPAGTVDLTL